MSPLVWTTKSTRNLADALTAAGHPVSDRTVARMLRAHGVQPAGQRQGHRGPPARGPGRPVRLPQRRVGEHIAAGQPVVSVDTKKKELVGEFKNGGREYQPQGSPVRVNVHDFPDKELGKAIPYGIYDVVGQHRLGVGRHRPRHLRVRRGDPAPLVGHRRAAPLPACRPAADLRRRRRLQRLPGPRLEDRTGRARRRDRADHHRLPPATGHQQMEQDRTPAVLPDHPELARPAADAATRSSST